MVGCFVYLVRALFAFGYVWIGLVTCVCLFVDCEFDCLVYRFTLMFFNCGCLVCLTIIAAYLHFSIGMNAVTHFAFVVFTACLFLDCFESCYFL